MGLEFAGLTDVGRKREHNEDSLLLAPAHALAVVADGMGGHESGEVASNIAVVTLEAFFEATKDPDATWPYRMDPKHDEHANRLIVGIQLANQRIREATRAKGGGNMGTTVVSALVKGDRAYYAWVGDSRGYLWRDGVLKPVTSDHSLINELIRTNRIRPEDVPHFQHKNVITRALGMADKVEVDVLVEELRDGDIVLVCCDGLTGMVEDERIGQMLGRDVPLDKSCQRLIDAANAAGGNDNITVALIRYSA